MTMIKVSETVSAGIRCFTRAQLLSVTRARELAAAMVTDYYKVAPREWSRMPYEVKTLRSLESSEITDDALAQTVCYGFKRQAGPVVLEEGDLYRICLQDHRILDASRQCGTSLGALVTYVLTHELVHVVRFGQRLQRIDLPEALRGREESRVESTTYAILAHTDDPEIKYVLSSRQDTLRQS